MEPDTLPESNHHRNPGLANSSEPISVESSASIDPVAPHDQTNNSGQRPTGRLVFLDLLDRSPAEGSEWTLTATNPRGGQIDLIVPFDGGVFVPEGKWTLKGKSEWLSRTKSVEVLGRRQRTVWVTRFTEHIVRVVDGLAQPISEAIVRWKDSSVRDAGAPQRLAEYGRRAFWDEEPFQEVITNTSGVARLENLSGPIGEIRVLAEGFLSTTLFLHGLTEAEVLVRLQPEPTRGRTLKVRSWPREIPLSGARLETPLGRIPGLSNSAGEIHLPSWVGDLLLVAQAPDHCAVAIQQSDLHEDGTIDLVEISSVRISVGTKAGIPCEDGVLMIDCRRMPDGSDGKPTNLDAVPLPPSGIVEVKLPQGADVDFFALSNIGWGGQESRDALRAEEKVQIVVAEGSSLEIEAEDEAGQPIDQFSVSAAYKSAVWDYGTTPPPAIIGARGGIASLPHPDRVREFTVQAEGYASAWIRPSPDPSRIRFGRLRLTLVRSSSLSLRIKSRRGEPVAGILLSLTEDRDATTVRRHPELFGGWPTAHPGWIEKAPRARLDYTDGTGLSSFTGLRAGTYEVEFFLGACRSQVDSPSFYDPAEVLINVPGPTSETIVLPVPRYVMIVANDATTGAPVHPLTIANPAKPLGVTGRAETNRWDGWVDEDVVAVTVGSPGYRIERLELPPWGVKPIRLHASLLPEEPGLLELHTEELDELRGESVALNAFQILRSESGERIGSIHVWQHRFLIQDSGPIAFYLPIPEKDVLLAMAKLRSPTGAVWEFEPKSIAWSPGATFRFFAKRVD